MAPEAALPSAALRARPARPARIAWVAVCLSATLLAAAGFEIHGRGHAQDLDAYHEHVRRVAATAVPFCTDDWLGSDLPTSPFAVALLKPNVLVNRAYRHIGSSQTATLMFVHCCDARDLLGHYPPVCYPAHGYVTDSASPHAWRVGGETIDGMRYRYSRTNAEGTSQFVVDNFMVLPSGGFGRDMDSVNRVARDPSLRRRGAAQVQVVTDATMSDESRDTAFVAIVGRIQTLLDAVGRRAGDDD